MSSRMFELNSHLRAGRFMKRLGAVVAGAVVLAACSSATPSGNSTTTGGSTASGGTLQVAVVAPFTGAAAEFGVLLSNPCKAASKLINGAGGVLGKTLSCLPVDDYGDPADAVPSVQKAFATNSNIAMAEGFESNTAATTIPLIERQKIPFFTTNGLVSYDSQTNPYFYRMSPSDQQNGAAYAVAADNLGYKRVAVIYANNIGASGNIPGTTAAASKLGMTLTTNLTIPGDVASYSSTVERVIASHPQALIFYADPQTSATFLANYSQLTNGKLPPMVTGESNIVPEFVTALHKVLKLSYITNDIYFVGQNISKTEPAYPDFASSMTAVGAPAGAINGVVSSIYDGINILALAMIEAKSTVGSVYNKEVLGICAGSAGATVVHNFAEGAAALKAGKKIQYVGTGGVIKFNSAHNFVGSWAVLHITASGNPNQVSTIAGTLVISDAG